MRLPDRLRLLQELSGLTQTELARQLDVSYVSLSRWINGKAVPRRAAQVRIDRLLAHFLGTSAPVDDPVAAKKAALAAQARRNTSVLASILKKPDIVDEFVLRLTYTSNRIEGSTLSEAETATVLFGNIGLPRRAFADQIAAKNHQAALQALFRHLETGENLDEAIILHLHGVLMNGLIDDAGAYRRHAVRIVGANIPTVNYLAIPQKMAALAGELTTANNDVIRHAAEIHAHFEQIHPFADGNGRVGRLLLHAMLLRKNHPPAIIRPERKRLYYAALNEAQRGGGSGRLEGVFCDGILEGFRILRRE